MTEAKSSKVRSALLITALLLLVFGGVAIALVMLVQHKAGQNHTIAKAEQLADAAEIKNTVTIEALSTSQREIKESIALLETIPPSAGSAYQRAQTKSAQIRFRLETVEQRLENENAALSSLEDAKKLAREASDIGNNPPHDAATWQIAGAKWQNAVKLLEKIPANTFASSQAKQKLSNYRNNYSLVNQHVKIENAALATLKKAQVLARQASNINSQSTVDLQKGRRNLLQAISLLRKIPVHTVAYAQSQENLAIYTNQNNLITRIGIVNNRLQAQQEQLQLFVFESNWVNMGFKKQAQLRTLKHRARRNRAKFIQGCTVRYKRQSKTGLSGLNNFYNELCKYMWAKL